MYKKRIDITINVFKSNSYLCEAHTNGINLSLDTTIFLTVMSN